MELPIRGEDKRPSSIFSTLHTPSIEATEPILSKACDKIKLKINIKKYVYLFNFIILVRTGGDSNSRWIFIHTRVPGVHLRPLGHLSNLKKSSVF